MVDLVYLKKKQLGIKYEKIVLFTKKLAIFNISLIKKAYIRDHLVESYRLV